MPAAKCYCRPQRDPVPRWPCEDASTAFRLCCLSATIYDVRCWGVQGDRDRYVDYSPGDIIGQRGTRTGAQYTINCDPEDQYTNTNLRGSVAFMFPDPDANPDVPDLQDAVNPWLPCPCVQTELQANGLYYTTLKTWVGISWSYSCDTGLVSFRAVWGSGGLFAWQQYYQMVNQLAGVPAVTTADPDWYLDNEITIPYATENDTNRLSRFSVKLKMTCDARDPCIPFTCWPVCMAKVCDGVTYVKDIYFSVSGCECLNVDAGLAGFGGADIQFRFGSSEAAPRPCAYVNVQYSCNYSGSLIRLVSIQGRIGGITTYTDIVLTTCAGGEWTDSFTLDPAHFQDSNCTSTVTVDVTSGGTWRIP